MTQDLIERTAREWVMSDTRRAAQELKRLTQDASRREPASTQEIVAALVLLAGRLDIAANRVW